MGQPTTPCDTPNRQPDTSTGHEPTAEHLPSRPTPLADCHQQLGQLDDAASARRRAIDALEPVAQGTVGWVLALLRLGDLRHIQGHYDDAEDILSRALAAAPTHRHGDGMPPRAALNAIGIRYDTGRYDAAATAYSEALGSHEDHWISPAAAAPLTAAGCAGERVAGSSGDRRGSGTGRSPTPARDRFVTADALSHKFRRLGVAAGVEWPALHRAAPRRRHPTRR